MASSEFPLRTNNEMSRILSIFNGSNEIEVLKNMFLERIKYSWTVRGNKMSNTFEKKTQPPHGYHIMKGLAFVIVSRQFTEYIISEQKPLDLLKWAEDTFSPDEW